MNLATTTPAIAKPILMAAFYAIGTILLIVAVWRLVRAAHAHSTLRLNTPHFGPTPPSNGKNRDMQMESVTK